jgi:hypothetical protein
LALLIFLPVFVAGRNPEYLLHIKGVLVNREGAPLKEKTVIFYPLDAKGMAIGINTLNKDGQVDLWNAKAKTDAEGAFTLNVPKVSMIGKEAITEGALSLDEFPGGVVTAVILNIQYADPNLKPEYGFVRKERLSLLSKDREVIKVRMDNKAGVIDIGRIAIE